ncbi:hypothetical protein NA57DRAFT_79548 [Rhizodiscina lignyota]|uniref:Ecp2 effector protein-like domain-containing protein n=1 Tax=Rhizodiscina lignyota TaxID=1504668 RepID=A0A9P4I9V7_9PEZI|nr:hypothetical protein NA57DRAFT_79548 [Rhizodiscina lignyota]
MKFVQKTIIVAVTLCVAARAAPLKARAATTENDVATSTLFKRQSVNDCGDSTFINQTSDGSPLIADCKAMITDIIPGMTYDISDFEQSTVVKANTCGFGVQFDGGGVLEIGGQDMIDVINTAISKFPSTNGKIGAQGVMSCQQELLPNTQVTWGLFHT